MKHQNPNLLTKLQDAVLAGHVYHFLMEEGRLSIPLLPGKYYYMSLVHFTVFSCALVQANLYTITTLDGLYKGTLIIPWEDFLQNEF
jgi:hypothetical protein